MVIRMTQEMRNQRKIGPWGVAAIVVGTTLVYILLTVVLVFCLQNLFVSQERGESPAETVVSLEQAVTIVSWEQAVDGIVSLDVGENLVAICQNNSDITISRVEISVPIEFLVDGVLVSGAVTGEASDIPPGTTFEVVLSSYDLGSHPTPKVILTDTDNAKIASTQ
jgi:hypothetical protein